MKRNRSNPDQSTEETAGEPAPSRERSSSLLRECWADLRGRPRPVAEPDFEEQARIDAGVGGPGTGGIGIDDDGISRMRRRYESSSH